MESEIVIDNVVLEYELYKNRTDNLKEYFVKMFSRSKKNGEIEKFQALKGINLKFENGERVGIIGHNGAGKSTLLKIIAGILRPSSGSIKVRGTVQPLIEVAAGFNPDLTGRENIYLNGYMLGFSKDQIEEKEQEIIDFSGLEEFIDTPIKYYSSGMSVRLAFTIATSVDPEILVFDEMLGAGDVNFTEKASKRINDLIGKAKLMIVVTHDLELLHLLVDRVIVLKAGRIFFDGAFEEAKKVYLEDMQVTE